MELKIIPPMDINTKELEESLDGIDNLVNAEIRRARKNAFFHSNWSRDSSAPAPTYILNLEYSGQGRLRNFVLKRLMKRVFKKVDKRIKIK